MKNKIFKLIVFLLLLSNIFSLSFSIMFNYKAEEEYFLRSYDKNSLKLYNNSTENKPSNIPIVLINETKKNFGKYFDKNILEFKYLDLDCSGAQERTFNDFWLNKKATTTSYFEHYYTNLKEDAELYAYVEIGSKKRVEIDQKRAFSPDYINNMNSEIKTRAAETYSGLSKVVTVKHKTLLRLPVDGEMYDFIYNEANYER